MRHVLAVLLASAVAVAGCSSSGGGDPSTSGPSASSSRASDPAAAELAAKVSAALGGITSAHLDVDAGALGGTITGDVAFADGATTASDLTIVQSGQTIEVIEVDGSTVAKLPAAHNTSGKPYVEVSSDSTNEFVRGLVGTLTLVRAATALENLTGLLGGAASNVRTTSTNAYSFDVDPAKVSGDLGSALSLAGSTLPVTLKLDAEGRPSEVVISVPLGDQRVPLTVRVSDYDAPVSIEAPPADQVAP